MYPKKVPTVNFPVGTFFLTKDFQKIPIKKSYIDFLSAYQFQQKLAGSRK